MNNFWKRSVTGILYVGVVIGAVLWDELSFLGLLLLMCIFCLFEYTALFKQRHTAPPVVVTIFCGALYFLLRELDSAHILPTYFVDFSYPLLFVPFIIELFSGHRRSFSSAGLGVAGIVYVSISLWCFVEIAYIGGVYRPILILGYFILIWCSDTFAYIVGNLIGKTKLFESVSPKKTWEGVIGGGVFTIAASLVLLYFFPDVLSLFEWVGLALIIVVFGIIGDLVKSMLKRNSNVKESGKVLPGHGGVLDRLDSLMFSTPFAMVFLKLTALFYK